MQYALKDYQEDAVRAVLSHLTDAKDEYHKKGRRSAFALSATTGAGKTDIASAVIEALFRGADSFDFTTDPSAVVLWVTDDPPLNEQTRSRMISAADRLDVGQLVIIGNGTGKAPFDQQKLEAGHVYFLNVQKFRSGSTWIKRGDRNYTLWDTIRNTIEDPDLTLYLVLDEAHRGMKRQTNKADGEPRSTIVQRMINGHEGVPAVPVVWGISATIDRFNAAMQEANAEGRVTYPAVNIDPVKVQDSGLLKDTIVLDFPDEKGDFETTLLRVAVREAVEVTERWATYSKDQGLTGPVLPLLVVQVPNKVSENELKRFLDVIYEEWPGLSSDAVANVFGEHNDLLLSGYKVPYVQPQDVQDASHIRVLLAKDAVSTGWDCPRAEVLFSLRPAVDRTHITQMLGRMVRTPLARRVQSDDRLNSVSCFLPHFNFKTALGVANRLTGKAKGDPDESDTESSIPGRKVLIAPVELRWNPNAPAKVKDFVSELPSEPKPVAQTKPVRRLLTLAAALARDSLMKDPNETALQSLYQLLDGQLAQHQSAVQGAVDEILKADILRMTASLIDQSTNSDRHEVSTDARTVDDAFRLPTRALGAAVANGYVKYIVAKGTTDALEARARVAALTRVEGVLAAVEEQADKLTKQWLGQYRVKILGLPEERQATYALIRSQARTPEHQDTVLPDVLQEESKDSDGNLQPTRPLHVLSDPAGDFPISGLKYDWERTVVDTELGRDDVVAWYRNPSHATAQAIRVPYKIGQDWKSMQPDFIFISRNANGDLSAAIVDPHSTHLSDALPKLVGLASFAEKFSDKYQRIDSIAKNSAGKVVVLDMLDASVRAAVKAADDIITLFDDQVAVPYL